MNKLELESILRFMMKEILHSEKDGISEEYQSYALIRLGMFLSQFDKYQTRYRNLDPDLVKFNMEMFSLYIQLRKKVYLYEIFYSVGYAKSYIGTISEGTYKKFKHQIILNLNDLVKNLSNS